MAFKRALIVDDSATARQSLAKLLAQHELEVIFAGSGEQALTLLQHELVDVIFMDHSMPGMNGLETVSAIKANPRTATIPVMMYTAKEGEVYVGQARALGAVDVLSKQVEPGVLFERLNRLGLVEDRRRTDSAASSPETPKRRLTDLADEVDREYEQRALGVSVQTQVVRVLEEQHLKLRASILNNQRRFAHEVATEILESLPGAGAREPAAGTSVNGRTRARATALVTAALATALLTVAGLAWQLMNQRDAARLEAARLTQASRNELDALYRRQEGLNTVLQTRQQEARALSTTAITALEWAFNQSAPIAFQELPFGDVTARRLEELLPRLAMLNFRGRVQLTAELAPFCLDRDTFGDLTLAPADVPAEDCEVTGHPRAGATSAPLESIEFATALSQAETYPEIAVDVSVQPLSAPDLWPGALPATAGEWNHQASAANRVRYRFIPEPPEPAMAMTR